MIMGCSFHHPGQVVPVTAELEYQGEGLAEIVVVEFLIVENVLTERVRFSVDEPVKSLEFVGLQFWLLKYIAEVFLLNEIKEVFDDIAHAVGDQRGRLLVVLDDGPVRVVIILDLVVGHGEDLAPRRIFAEPEKFVECYNSSR